MPTNNFVQRAVNFRGLVPGSVASDYDGLVWIQGQPQPTSGFIPATLSECNRAEPFVINFSVGPGNYFYKIRHIPSGQFGGTSPFTIASGSQTGNPTCDLVWDDIQTPGSPVSLNTRWVGGVRQLYISLYSARANIAPFTTRIYNANVNEVHSFLWTNPQGQWHNLPGSLGSGIYGVEVFDNTGCVTTRRNVTFFAEIGDTQTTTPIAGFVKMAIGYAAGTNEASVHIDGPNMLLRVSAPTAPQPSGLTWVNAPGDTSWNSMSFIPGTTQFAEAGYTRVYRLNPLVLGSGGLVNGKLYHFDVKIQGSTQFFRTEFTMPSANISPVQIIYTAGAPPVIVPPVIPGGPMVPVIISEGYDSLSNFSITGTSENWLITDLTVRNPAAGKEWMYQVGEKVIRQAGRLINEPWQSNYPGRVTKISIKIGGDINKYPYNPGAGQTGPWWDPDMIELFDKGDNSATVIFSFKPAVAAVVPPGGGGVSNSGNYAGMFVIERAGRRYTYTDTPDLRLDVASDGKVKLLVGPATKLSANGLKTCNPYVLINERAPRQAFRDALLGASGAVFATGKSYAIAITWMPNDVFSSYADLANQQKMEATSRREDNKYQNTAGQDYIYLTIENQ